ncbi:MAG: hypothetical protein ACI959_000148 [Limisphaerales bacterium]|jgi:hypothetical protein
MSQGIIAAKNKESASDHRLTQEELMQGVNQKTQSALNLDLVNSDDGVQKAPRYGQELAAQFLDTIRMGKAVKDLQTALANLDPDKLKTELNTDAKRKAFWINIYNGFGQIYLSTDHFITLSRIQALFYFEKKRFKIAGWRLSLNDVEHGILRRSRIWWARGFLKKWIPSGKERKFRVDILDPRIHFALNCAAKSCPPIRFYEADKIEAQLDLASSAYLQATVHFDAAENRIYLPELFRFFPKDFIGPGFKPTYRARKRGFVKFLNRYGKFLDPNNVPRIKYEPWDSSSQLANFHTEVSNSH